MKKILTTAIILVLASLCFAEDLKQVSKPKLSIFDNMPAAATDNFFAPFVNPAAGAFDNNSGFGYIGKFHKEDDELKDDANDYMLIMALGGLTYAYQNDQGKTSNHYLSSNQKIMRNLYLGSTFKWNDTNFADGLATASLLYRPTNYLSTAFVAKNMFKGRKDASMQIGTAFRPLYSTNWGKRLTITADVNYLTYIDNDNQKEETGFIKPTIGLQTEIIDGFNLGGSYQLEDETALLNFSVNFNSLSIGAMGYTQETQKKDNDLTSGYSYAFINSKVFHSVLNPKIERFYDYKLSGSIVEKQTKMFEIGPFEFISSKGKTIDEVKKTIKKLKNDETVKGIVFKSGSVSASFANYNELKNALLDFKSAGKKIVYYYEGINNINYCLAAAVADKIYLNPHGGVDLKGISISQYYVKSLLDTLGVDFYNFRSHKYKTAGNSFSENAMTDGERQALDTVLEGLYTEMKNMISYGRGNKLTKSVDEIIDNGPYMIANDALELGLVDELIYEDELKSRLKKLYNNDRISSKKPDEYVKTNWSEESKYNIAVIYALGGIHSGKSKGKSIGSVTTSSQIKAANAHPDIDAIVLRIDSGGGSALASDIIARQVQLCKKPIIASMGGTAASGGYFIAAKANKIVADPATITGSIGVIGMIPNLSKLYDKILVNWSRVKKGKHSDMFALSRPMTEEEKQKISKSIKHTYDNFINVVAEGRNMTYDQVHEVAQGRIWTGAQAKERGLVDELGGLDKAIELAVKQLGNKKKANIVVVDGKKSGITIELEGDIPFLSTKAMLPPGFDTLYEAAKKYMTPKNEIILMQMPYDIPSELK